MINKTTTLLIFTMLALMAYGGKPTLIPVSEGYSGTSVNNAIFRNSSLVTCGDQQYIAYYDNDSYVTLGKRNTNQDEWTISRTQYRGNIKDAHNVISIGVDGNGYIHVSFDHHGHPLRYAMSIEPGSLQLGELKAMTGDDERDVTYPEFYTLANGDLLFAYRSGASGRGNLVLKRYDIAKGQWQLVHDKLIDGEDQRNAYWQMTVGDNGDIHLSWVWRETWMVETNHDLCYAKSTDGGVTWQRSDGTPQQLPITASNAEYAWHIPQKSELINQTSMVTDAKGNPYIATYWRDADSDTPQYRLVWHDGKEWRQTQVGQRTQPFSLAGGGTKMIPISRPRLVTDGKKAYYIYRDAERGSKVSVAFTKNLKKGKWAVSDLTKFSVDAWEPTLDLNRWQQDRILDIFVQEAHQGDGEKAITSEPTMIYVLEIK